MINTEQVRETVIVDFENVLLGNHLYLEEVFTAWRQNGLKSFLRNLYNLLLEDYKTQNSLLSLPYSANAISILLEHYDNHEIVLLSHRQNAQYAERAQKELLIHGIFISSITLYDTVPEKESLLEDSNYILGTLSDFRVLKKLKTVSFILPFGLELLLSFFTKRVIAKRSLLFYGIFSILWEYFAIIWPIIACWPAMFEIHVVNLWTINGTFFSTMVWIGFFHLLRTLRELDQERLLSQRMYEPRCGKNFIYSTRSLSFASGLLFLYLLGGLLLLVVYPLGSLVGLCVGLTYFFFMLFRFRTFVMLGVSVALQFLVQPKFTAVFFKTIFS